MSEPIRVDRRTALKWVAMAASTVPLLHGRVFAAPPVAKAKGYGTDPNVNKVYKPGELWPLTLTPGLRRAAAALCDVIIPADSSSPAASDVGVVDFIDEWISAPYETQRADRKTILEGLGWLEKESKGRFKAFFV